MSDLLTLTRAQGANRALVEREVTLAGDRRLVLADEPVLANGFRKMVRNLEYDVAEMALTTYLTAKQHGVAFTALPVFLVRDFHHGATQILRGGPISTPHDLTGRRVGVNRGYTVTTGVWGRSVLAAQGLDLDSVTWVCSGDEHVTSYAPPTNVVSAPKGRSLAELLLSGELEAVVGAAIDHPDVVPLIPDSDEAGLATLGTGGVFPINHLVVVRDALLAEDPDVARAVFDAFVESKRRYLEALGDGLAETRQDRLLAAVGRQTGTDPLPYGLEANRAALEELVRHAVSQHILGEPVDLDRAVLAFEE